jgi:putative IMPACT (imprinted ancient) family translation regulator
VAGLTRTYREVTRALLDGATCVRAEERLVIQLECLFEAVPDVMKLIKEFELEVQGQTFEDKARFVLRIGRNSIDFLRQRIQQVSGKGQKTISLQVL